MAKIREKLSFGICFTRAVARVGRCSAELRSAAGAQYETPLLHHLHHSIAAVPIGLVPLKTNQTRQTPGSSGIILKCSSRLLLMELGG